METITNKELTSLLKLPGQPCVSFYEPTQPGGAAKDPIQFKNLIAQAEAKLRKSMDEDAAKKMLRPARRLLDERDFWKNTSEGLAFFLTPQEHRCYRLRRAFTPCVMVGPRFFVKPLFALIDAAPHYYVLALNQNHLRLWEGDASMLREVELKTMPTSLAEALKTHDRDETVSLRTIHGGSNASAALFYGLGGGVDTAKDDLLQYFQKVDRGLHDYLPAKAPLILAGVEYLWPIYRRANRHPHLLEHGIPGNPERCSAKELHERAWNLVRERYEEPIRKARERFAALAGTGRTCSNPPEVIGAACQGRRHSRHFHR